MKFNTNLYLGLIILLVSQLVQGQNAISIYKQLEKFNFLGSVLYVAAHPDDENTRMISYFSNHKNARTAYLSLTRGDGGQNLIGTELKEGLGVIRTQELLAARKIDGGEQFFTTAVDFGFSKHPDETLQIWDKTAILSQVVSRIRTFQPDIIINRFDHRTPGTTHGHHTTSALLSMEAFDLANDPTAFPNQLKSTGLWQPKRQFFNTSWWFYGSREKFKAANKSNLISMDTGGFDPMTGVSNSEIAANSRSQHKSQGFGSAPSYGEQVEYLELLKGEATQNNDPFSGIDTSWNRVPGGAVIAKSTEKALANFDFKAPYKSLPALIDIYTALEQLPNNHWKPIKLKLLKTIITQCAGFRLQANTTDAIGNPDTQIQLKLLALNPTPLKIQLKAIKIGTQTITPNTLLSDNKLWETTTRIELPNTLTAPYWLTKKGTLGNYAVADSALIGVPETPNPLMAAFIFEFENKIFTLTQPLQHRTTDPVEGEIVSPFQILPKVTVQATQPVYLFSDATPKTVFIAVQSNASNFKGDLKLNLPKSWSVNPESQPIHIQQKGELQNFSFKITAPKEDHSGEMHAVVTSNGQNYSFGLQEIDYPHIPKQYQLYPNSARVVKVDLKTKVQKVGYIRGAGDKIPESLKAVGLHVDAIEADAITIKKLQDYPTVIMGIRAFNVKNALSYKNAVLWEYVANGGTVIVQYNTSRGLKTNAIAPYPLRLSRDRVTDEQASVSYVNPAHPLLQSPNVLMPADFNGWVQERGLYFPNQWDAAFTPIFKMNDARETPKQGSVLVADYGKGKFIYTGLSFFRQLPAGVPGAYRLFLNMISYGH